MPETILIFGLPGVGKTTFIECAANISENFQRVSGGELIQKGLQEAQRDQLREKSEDHIISNQNLLVDNFREYRKKSTKNLLFDGHCIVSNDSKIVEIPAEIISRLNPDKLILIEDNPHEIVSRRELDVSRPNRQIQEHTEVARLQERQRLLCKAYSEKIDMDLIILESPSKASFLEACGINN